MNYKPRTETHNVASEGLARYIIYKRIHPNNGDVTGSMEMEINNMFGAGFEPHNSCRFGNSMFSITLPMFPDMITLSTHTHCRGSLPEKSVHITKLIPLEL